MILELNFFFFFSCSLAEFSSPAAQRFDGRGILLFAVRLRITRREAAGPFSR